MFCERYHTPDFGKQRPRWMWKVLSSVNVKPEIAQTRENEKEEQTHFLCTVTLFFVIDDIWLCSLVSFSNHGPILRFLLSYFTLFISFSFSHCLPHEVVIALKSGNQKTRKANQLISCMAFYLSPLSFQVVSCIFASHTTVALCRRSAGGGLVGFVCLAAEG